MLMPALRIIVNKSIPSRCGKCAKCQIFGTFATPNTKNTSHQMLYMC